MSARSAGVARSARGMRKTTRCERRGVDLATVYHVNVTGTAGWLLAATWVGLALLTACWALVPYVRLAGDGRPRPEEVWGETARHLGYPDRVEPAARTSERAELRSEGENAWDVTARAEVTYRSGCSGSRLPCASPSRCSYY